MKVLSTAGLTKLIQLIKSSFISSDNVEQITTVGIDVVPTTNSSNLITSGGVKTAVQNKVTASVSGSKLTLSK